MADASDAYKKGDVMNALKDQMAAMVEEQKKMVDPNHVDDDSEGEENSSSDEEAHQANEFTFISAIDVGSHFIDVNPSNELQFEVFEGNFITQMTINNPCKACPVAFFVFTSAQIPVKIVPNCGFIPNEFQQVVKIIWEAQSQPNQWKLENSMFFVKALPLSPEMKVSYQLLCSQHSIQIDEMNQQLERVFNTYNVNILFTTHHFPCRVNQAMFNPQ